MKKRRDGRVPTKDELLDFLAERRVTTPVRHVLRQFGVKGAAKNELKDMLKELQNEGAILKGRGKKIAHAGKLPDVAVVEIIDRDADGELLARPVSWEREEAPPHIVLAPGTGAGREGDPALGIGDRILARLAEQKDGTYEAQLVRRLGQSAHHILGVLARVDGEMRVRPVDRKAKLELVVSRGDEGGAKEGELVLVDPLPGRAQGLPRARVKERLGSIDKPGAFSLIAIHAHGIPDKFPQRAIDEATNATPATMDERQDLRPVPLITIDPEDARDHDDAVWAGADDDPANKGGHVVVVAIADVAFYVTPGAGLDNEAVKRGNSVYFPDRVVPMLPERLSNDLCSLKDNVDRPVLAVRMVFDAQGNKRKHTFARAMMRSAARLTYKQVQDAIDGRPDAVTRPLIGPVIAPLYAAYHVLSLARDKRSPLALDLPERKVTLDAQGRVASVAFKDRYDSMRLIEEFMIQANVAAAEVLEAKRSPLVYRVHDEPSREKIESLAEVLNSANIPFTKGQALRAGVFNHVLARAKGTPHADMINEVVLRTQAQAEYNAANIGHFGLNLRRYAHFTSPIRRYADLIVHRALIRALGFGKDGLTDREINKLKDTATSISAAERRGMAAERDAMDRYLTAYMSAHIGAEFPGRVSGVTRFGLFVRLDDSGADGLIPIRSIGNEFFFHDEKRHALVGQRSGLTFRLGDPVRVKLLEAAPVTGGLRFELLEGGSVGARPQRDQRAHKEKPKHRKHGRRRS